MGWIRLDTDWYMHPKFTGLGVEAALFWAPVAWSNHYMTDGRFDQAQAEGVGAHLGLSKDQTCNALVTLVTRALLFRYTPEEGCFTVHGFLERYASRARRKAAIETARQQTLKRIHKLRGVNRNERYSAVTPGGCNAAVPTSTSLSSSPSTESRRRIRLRCKTPWPEQLTLSEAMGDYAKKFGCKRPDLAFACFQDRAHATGAQYLDWQAAWRNWCRNHDRFGCPCQSVPAQPRAQEYFTAKGQERRYAQEEQEAARTRSGEVAGRPVTTVGDVLDTLKTQGKAKAT